MKTFYAPLVEVLDVKESSGVFGNIEEILLCNTVSDFHDVVTNTANPDLFCLRHF